jgi:hypothetical protein
MDKIVWRIFDPDNVIALGAGALAGAFTPAVCQVSIGTTGE